MLLQPNLSPIPKLLIVLVQPSPEFEQILRAVSPASRIVVVARVEDWATHEAARDRALVFVEKSEEEHVLSRLDPLDDSGAPKWTCVVWDSRSAAISETNLRALLQSGLRRHVLERENARLRGDLRTFSRRITHDLRSPLNAISTSAEVIREVLGEHLPHEVELTDPILESAREILPVLDQLTIATRATAIPTEHKNFSMEDAVHNTLDRLTSKSMAAGATVVTAENWPRVHGVPAWTESIWAQLLNNSLMHAGAKPRIELGWEPSAAGYRFWVKDGGQVSEEKRPRLFHPFNLRHQSDAPHGMGLAIVQRLVELQSGQVGFEALPGGGSLFSFELPGATS